jgi:hypothetical protein
VTRRFLALLAATALASTTATVTIGLGNDPKGVLTCVYPLDASGIDAVLTSAGSPLAGTGAVFVNSAASAGLDPRALMAIAGHETIFETYAPARTIRNPFGIGPGRSFPSEAEAIAFAANLLATSYVGQGRRTLAEISGKWAPIGAQNDPRNLNANWVTGVGTLYARLGGNPQAPITLDSQPVDCAANAADTPAPTPQATPPGPPAEGVVTWNGTQPIVDEPLMQRGADPASGGPATIAGFTFPYVPAGAPIRFRDDFAEPGPARCFAAAIRCAVTLDAGAGARVVATIGGELLPATQTEQAAGLAFWIVGGAGDRIGYSGLATYAPGIAAGAQVTAGQLLGESAVTTALTWERNGQRINPYPLLTATRPSDG